MTRHAKIACVSLLIQTSTMEKKYKILFVCLGNICRSPGCRRNIAEAIAKSKTVREYRSRFAGTYGGHAGELPDSRMRAHAARRGYKLTHRSRQIKWDDFEKFDLILGMDDTNISNLQRLAPDPESLGQKYGELPILQKITIRSYPRPLLFGKRRFELVLDILEDACNGLIEELKNRK